MSDIDYILNIFICHELIMLNKCTAQALHRLSCLNTSHLCFETETFIKKLSNFINTVLFYPPSF